MAPPDLPRRAKNPQVPGKIVPPADSDVYWSAESPDSPDDAEVALRLSQAVAAGPDGEDPGPDEMEYAHACYENWKLTQPNETTDSLPQVTAAMKDADKNWPKTPGKGTGPYAGRPLRPTQQQQLESQKKQQQEHPQLWIPNQSDHMMVLSTQRYLCDQIANMAGAIRLLSSRAMVTENSMVRWGEPQIGGRSPTEVHERASAALGQIINESKLQAGATNERMLQNMCAAKTAAATPETPQTPKE
jgi:hypothetical protein